MGVDLKIQKSWKTATEVILPYIKKQPPSYGRIIAIIGINGNSKNRRFPLKTILEYTNMGVPYVEADCLKDCIPVTPDPEIHSFKAQLLYFNTHRHLYNTR